MMSTQTSLVFCILLVLLHLNVCLAEDFAVQVDVGLQRLGDKNHIFMDHLLWTSNSSNNSLSCKSTVRCAAACIQDPNCYFFTVTKSVDNKDLCVECRGHSWKPTIGGSKPGSRLYQLTNKHVITTTTPTTTTTTTPTTTTTTPTTTATPWYFSTCARNGDCTALEPNSVCSSTDNKCICARDYYYSISMQTCQTSCPQANMQTTWVVYDGDLLTSAYASGSGYPKTETLASCQSLCHAETACKSINHCPNSNNCAVNVKESTAASVSWAKNNNCIHYKRQCA